VAPPSRSLRPKTRGLGLVLGSLFVNGDSNQDGPSNEGQCRDGATQLGTRTERDVLSAPVLLLNRYFSPVSLATARRALVLLYCGVGLAVDDRGDAHDFQTWRLLPVREQDDSLSIVGGDLRLPRVLHLQRYDRYPTPKVRLTRRNLLLRDDYRCQYCGRRPGARGLNIDHVLPRSRGGRDEWDNLVISCKSCNLRKGRRTPAEAGMGLLTTPREPHWSLVAHIMMATSEPFAEWQPFLKAG
jgi:5-methylcytosine-specific restriction endonuclease McrA